MERARRGRGNISQPEIQCEIFMKSGLRASSLAFWRKLRTKCREAGLEGPPHTTAHEGSSAHHRLTGAAPQGLAWSAAACLLTCSMLETNWMGTGALIASYKYGAASLPLGTAMLFTNGRAPCCFGPAVKTGINVQTPGVPPESESALDHFGSSC